MLQASYEEQVNPWFEAIAPNLMDLEYGLYHSGILQNGPGEYNYILDEFGRSEYILVQAEDTTNTSWEWRINDAIHGVTVIITIPNIFEAMYSDDEGNMIIDFTATTFKYTITSANNPNALYEATLQIGSSNVNTITIVDGTERIYIKVPAGPTAELTAFLDTDVNKPGQEIVVDGTLNFTQATEELIFTLDGNITTELATFTGNLTFSIEENLTINMYNLGPITISGDGTLTTPVFELSGGFAIAFEQVKEGTEPILIAASFNSSYTSPTIEFTGEVSFEYVNYETAPVAPEFVCGLEGHLSHSNGDQYDMVLSVATGLEGDVEIEFDLARHNFTLTGTLSTSATVEGQNVKIDVTDDQGTQLHIDYYDTTVDGTEVGSIIGADGTKYASIKVAGASLGAPTFTIEYTTGGQFEFLPVFAFEI